MQHFDKAIHHLAVDTANFSECPEDADDTVVFELVVPRAAKVPAARPTIELTKLVVQLASASSTVPSSALTELRVNNTAHGADWCITATLQAPRLPARY